MVIYAKMYYINLDLFNYGHYKSVSTVGQPFSSGEAGENG